MRAIGIPGNAPGVLTAPRGLAVTPTGELLVADTGNHRIELFAPGTYAYASSWSGAGAGFPAFATPMGVDVGASGEVYVADPVERVVVGLSGESGAPLSELGPGPPAPRGTRRRGRLTVVEQPLRRRRGTERCPRLLARGGVPGRVG